MWSVAHKSLSSYPSSDRFSSLSLSLSVSLALTLSHSLSVSHSLYLILCLCPSLCLSALNLSSLFVSPTHLLFPIPGYGCGLPLARLYSQYFGGGLDVKSMEGFGTDSYCHINWLGNNCENLPVGVTSSPAERDSSLL